MVSAFHVHLMHSKSELKEMKDKTIRATQLFIGCYAGDLITDVPFLFLLWRRLFLGILIVLEASSVKPRLPWLYVPAFMSLTLA